MATRPTVLRVVAVLLCSLFVGAVGVAGIAGGWSVWWSPMALPTTVVASSAPSPSYAAVLAYGGGWYGLSFLTWTGLAALGRRSVPSISLWAAATLLVANVACRATSFPRLLLFHTGLFAVGAWIALP